tara:strand:+ start:566 stop:745 length:180 start_codon:yes stop_codon:yes gene_type:complete
MFIAILIGDSVHVHRLYQFLLVHESVEGEGPTLREGRKVVDLLKVIDFYGGKFVKLLTF